MTLELATARYADFILPMGVPVQTSIGRPKFPIRYDLTEEAKRLMPWGLVGKGMSDVDFTDHYRARLEKAGPDALRRLFYGISGRHGGARVVLLCFESVHADLAITRTQRGGIGQFCHRRVFAAWWEERTGHHVPELSVMTSSAGEQLALVHDLHQGNPPRKEVQP
jgi:hypothetical protein